MFEVGRNPSTPSSGPMGRRARHPDVGYDAIGILGSPGPVAAYFLSNIPSTNQRRSQKLPVTCEEQSGVLPVSVQHLRPANSLVKRTHFSRRCKIAQVLAARLDRTTYFRYSQPKRIRSILN